MRRFLILLIVVTTAIAGCGQSSVKSSSQKLDQSYQPANSIGEAVTTVLAAEQQNDPAKSFALLAPDSRKDYKDVAGWSNRLKELPAVTGFKLDKSNGTSQVATVNHKAGLDPFIGLSPAQERQTWKGAKFPKGWLLSADPQTDPILPGDDKAPPAAKAWVEAVQACDQARATAMQAISTLFAAVTPTICKVPGVVATGNVEKLAEGPASTNIVAQYTPDALTWARVVPVTGPVAVKVILAPIGNEWKVLGLA